MPPAKRRSYSTQERESALVALILAGGNTSKTGQRLGIPQQTLSDWRCEDPERYERLQTDLAPRIAEKLASDAEELAIELLEAERAVTRKLMDNLDNLKPAEAAGALRNLSTSKSLQVDRISGPIRGRPRIVEVRNDAGQALLELGRRLGFNVEGTAVEISNTPELQAPDEQSAFGGER